MIRKRNTGQDQMNGTVRNRDDLLDIVVIDRDEMFAAHLLPVAAHCPPHARPDGVGGKSVFPNDSGHDFSEFIVQFPFLQQDLPDSFFTVRVNDVNIYFPRLEKTVDTVDRLNEVVEFAVDSDKNRVGTMTLKVASGAGKNRFCRQILNPAIRKINNALFPLFQRLFPIHRHGFRKNGFNRPALFFQVMPQQKMLLRLCLDNFQHLSGAVSYRVFRGKRPAWKAMRYERTPAVRRDQP